MAHHRHCSACNDTVITTAKESKIPPTKNVLDVRFVPGHPHEAWIECYKNTYDENAQPGSAEIKAQLEGEKINQLLHTKKERLKIFQQEVSSRVGKLQKLKREEERSRSHKLLEDEQLVVLQRSLGMKVPYKGTSEELQKLNKELLKSCIIPCHVDKKLVLSEIQKSNSQLERNSKKINFETTKAKLNLLSKKVQIDVGSLPGGLWSGSPQKAVSQDNTMHVYPRIKPLINWPVKDIWSGVDTIRLCADEDNLPVTKNNEMVSDRNMLANSHGAVEGNKQNEDETLLSVLQRNLVYDAVNCGHQVQLEKSQRENQYWKYRKIFMDIERDQVREKKRQEDHRKKIGRLKLHKETERKSTEDQITDFKTTSIHCHEDTKRIQEKTKNQRKSSIKQTCITNKEKEKELYRYIKALQEVARKRIELCNVEMPPLCQCGPSIWDCHPETCANNCIFYKNPNEYVKAFTTALSNYR